MISLLRPLTLYTKLTRLSKTIIQNSNFHSLFPTQQLENSLNPGGLFQIATRTNIRIHFPRPSETHRIRKHGWNSRMSKSTGRRVLMNRILKGRFIYSH